MVPRLQTMQSKSQPALGAKGAGSKTSSILNRSMAKQSQAKVAKHSIFFRPHTNPLTRAHFLQAKPSKPRKLLQTHAMTKDHSLSYSALRKGLPPLQPGAKATPQAVAQTQVKIGAPAPAVPSVQTFI